jgi:hypothetical protein
MTPLMLQDHLASSLVARRLPWIDAIPLGLAVDLVHVGPMRGFNALYSERHERSSLWAARTTFCYDIL